MAEVPIVERSEYMSPKQLAERWCVAVSTVGRIAQREGFTKLFLGHGQNGAVRYLRKEVEAYEQQRSVKS